MSRTSSCKKFALPFALILGGLSAIGGGIWLCIIAHHEQTIDQAIGQQFVEDHCGTFDNVKCTLIKDTQECKDLQDRCLADSNTTMEEAIPGGLLLFSGLASVVGGVCLWRNRQQPATTAPHRELLHGGPSSDPEDIELREMSYQAKDAAASL